MSKCQHVNRRSGQCPREALPGDSRCELHTYSDPEKDDKRIYHLTEHQRRLRHAELSQHEDLKSLREELGICRMILEERLNAVKTEVDLLAACGSLNTLLLTIEKLASSCHKLDQSVGTLLAKPTLLKVANDIVQILLVELEHIPGYERIVDNVSQKIITAISQANNE